MKRLPLILFAFFMFTTLGNASSIFSNELKKSNSITPENLVITTVPSDVLQRFYDSFVLDENGKFRGAYVGEIKNYTTMPEIISMINNSGVQLAGNVIYEEYKPKSRGCKKNPKWVCSLEGEVADL